MPTAAYTTLTISDGTTTANLVDGTNYALVAGGWAPSVAPLRVSTLGGGSPYEDVLEEITIDVLGSTGAVCLANLAKLSLLLDQAERWSRGESVAAVLLACQPQGSTLTAALKCAILGRAGESGVNTPATFNDLLMCYEIPNVKLAFRRRGLWLVATGETPAASAALANPSVMSVSFGSTATIASPTEATITLGTSATPALNQYLLVADRADRIQIVEAESLVFGASAEWTATTDVGYYPRGGSIAHYIPTDLLYKGLNVGSVTLPTTARRVAMFAAVRNNSSSDTFNLRAKIYGIVNVYSPPLLTINIGRAQIVFMGMVALAEPPLYVSVEVAASTITGPPTLDIDYIVLLDITDDCATIISLPNTPPDYALQVSPRDLTAPSPIIYHQQILGYAPASYMGNAHIVTRGTALAVVWLAQNPAVTAWTYVEGGAIKTTTLLGTRYQAYLTPQ